MDNSLQKNVSIIIPAYNVGKYISQALDSVIDQTYKNIEIIVVNDGSIDDTEKIVNIYKEKDIRITIYNQSNKGQSAARNLGFKMAKGEYFCIFDADDIMLPEKIESQVDFLEKNKSCDLTYSKVYYFIDETNNIYTRDLITPKSTDVYNKLLKYSNYISPNSVLFKRSVYDAFGGFDEDLRFAEDFDYWLHLSQKGVIIENQNEYLTLCRIRKGSAVWNSLGIYSCLLDVYKKYIPRIDKNLWLKIKYSKYLRGKILFHISLLKKPVEIDLNHDKTDKKSYVISNIASKLFNVLRKIKFVLIFKKVKDKKIKDYLKKIQSNKFL